MLARWEPAGIVRVESSFTADAGTMFAVERGAERFLRDAEASADGTTWSPLVRRGRQLEATPCDGHACRIRYRYLLRDAAARFDDLDTASIESELVEAPPSTWILSPTRPEVHSRVLRFRVATPEGTSFVTGVFPSEDASAAWDLTLDDLWTAPYSAFGVLRTHSIPVPGGSVQLSLGPGAALVSEDQITHWTADAARAVATYYGQFPMPGALVLIAIARGRWVGSGRTLAGGGGTTFVRIGEAAPLRAFAEDWVLVHEMIHLSFPSVPREHDWAEEGVATYVEPWARVRAGLVSEEEAWGALAEGLPNGLPRPGDRGLDQTHTWGRTYWGGALFWFLADVAIHAQTKNKKGLEHALRAVLAAGGTNAVRWPLTRVMEVGDRATGTNVLTDLYATMRASPHPVDLQPIFASLGVIADGGRARFDDRAPLAAVRRSITRGGDGS